MTTEKAIEAAPPEAQAQAEPATGWADLLAEGRLPRFVLILLGIWLIAVDNLVTATIMPSVGAELGGYAYFSWAIAGFQVGMVLAGASAGRLSEIFGLRAATAMAGLAFAAGCALSAAAPTMGLFLAGRVLQGIGGGWIAGFAMVAIALLFPERHVARVFAAAAAVWGVATVMGPMIGGLFAQAGDWRAVFWLFAAQGVILSAASLRLLRGDVSSRAGARIPWPQLGVLGLGIGAIALAQVTGSPGAALLLIAAGLAVLGLGLRIDGRAATRLLPHRAGDLRTVCGAGYAAMFALMAASMGLLVYGPALLQELRGLSPLWAGYAVAAQAMTWTLGAFVVAGASEAAERRWIRLGGACILAGAILLALVMREVVLGWVILGAAVTGAGFGFTSSLMNRRVLRVLSPEDRAIGASALIAVRQTGGAVGAAIAGAAANLAGFDAGLTPATAEAAGTWVFVAVLPLATAGTWAAWRLAGLPAGR